MNEAAVGVQDAWFRAVVESAPDGMLLVGDEGQILFANHQAEQMFGYDPGELNGSAVEVLVPPELRDIHRNHRAFYQSHPIFRGMGAGRELLGRRHDGSNFPVEISLSPVNTNSGRVFAAAIRDISQRKAADRKLANYAKQLESSNQELEHFAYVASHDLQAPLRTMLSFAELLREECSDELGEDALQYLQFIADGAATMRTMVSSLLEVSRVQRLKVDDHAVDAEKVVAQACKQLTEAIRESQAVVQCDSLPKLSGSANALTQLFQNLIGNAIKFRHPDQVPEVRIYERERTGNEAVICVRDNGIGIPVEQLNGVFEFFRRLHGDDKRYPGSGMGLAICRKIAEKHGGKLWAEAPPDGGTCFCCRLPLASVTKDSKAAA